MVTVEHNRLRSKPVPGAGNRWENLVAPRCGVACSTTLDASLWARQPTNDCSHREIPHDVRNALTGWPTAYAVGRREKEHR
jgi:hypothetical protein